MSAQKQMKEASPMKKPWWQRVRFVYRPSSTLAKVVVLSAIVLSTVTLLTIQGAIQNTRARTEGLKDNAAGLIQDNNELGDKLDNVGSKEFVEGVAQDELGRVDPDTTIYD